jgi:hypothetical protein
MSTDVLAAGVPRQVVRWYDHQHFDRLPHRTTWRATLECGHVLDFDEDEIVDLDLSQEVVGAPRGAGAMLPCPTCLEAEREEIVADLPGAD